MKKLISLTVNDKVYEVAVEPNQTLLDLLRDELGLTGTKQGCDVGDCGACTVLLDGKAVNSCLVLAVQADGRDGPDHRGARNRRGAAPHSAGLCGSRGHPVRLLQPGHDPLGQEPAGPNPHPSETEIRTAISGNLCRCTGYQKIVEAIRDVSEPPPNRTIPQGS